jgi:hypothetical protein
LECHDLNLTKLVLILLLQHLFLVGKLLDLGVEMVQSFYVFAAFSLSGLAARTFLGKSHISNLDPSGSRAYIRYFLARRSSNRTKFVGI